MFTSEFLFNLLFCVAYILSGAVILVCLRKLRFRIASYIFGTLYGVLMIYVPFYVGGNAMISALCGHYFDADMAFFFERSMRSILSAPTPFFHSVSIFTFVLALIVAAATVIILALISIRIIHAIKHASGYPVTIGDTEEAVKLRREVYKQTKQGIFLHYCRLLD